jgi:hypothetical protein
MVLLPALVVGPLGKMFERQYERPPEDSGAAASLPLPRSVMPTATAQAGSSTPTTPLASA